MGKTPDDDYVRKLVEADILSGKTPSADDYLRKLRVTADEFAKKSTALSNKLEWAQAYLDELPSKLQVSVGVEGTGLLMLLRHKDGWYLCYGTNKNNSELVVNASLLVKSKAALLLGELFGKLSTAMAEQLQDVEVGLEALKDSPFPSVELVRNEEF